jgi:MFS family permease
MHHRPKHHEAAKTATGSHGPHPWLLPVLLVAQLMVILDITAVNIALPHIARDLRLSGASISWTITSYSLIFGSLLLFGGRAADRAPRGERLAALMPVERRGDERQRRR